MPRNLYRRGDIWWARLAVDGREIRRSLRTSNRAEAEKRLAELKRQAEHTKFWGHERPTYAQAVVQWSETAASGLKPGTAARYRCSARALDPHFGNLYLDQLTKRTIACFVAARKKADATNATIRRDLTALSRILAVAVASGWADENPARAWDRSVLRERRDPILPPGLAEIELVARAAPPAFSRLIRFAAQTGMRQEEVASLEWRDIDGAMVTLTRTKTSRPRTIRLATPGGDATGTLAGTPRHIRSGWVFWHAQGDRYRQPATAFARLVGRVVADEARAGRSFRAFRFHDLRHAFAMRWLRAGGDIYALSQHLGHSSVTTTERYLGFRAFEETAQNPAQSERFADG
jgi:integrase